MKSATAILKLDRTVSKPIIIETLRSYHAFYGINGISENDENDAIIVVTIENVLNAHHLKTIPGVKSVLYNS